jgi:hypothetical protein
MKALGLGEGRGRNAPPHRRAFARPTELPDHAELPARISRGSAEVSIRVECAGLGVDLQLAPNSLHPRLPARISISLRHRELNCSAHGLPIHRASWRRAQVKCRAARSPPDNGEMGLTRRSLWSIGSVPWTRGHRSATHRTARLGRNHKIPKTRQKLAATAQLQFRPPP